MIEAWYNPKEFANIISLKTLKSKYRVTYNSDDCGWVFTVCTPISIVDFYPHSHEMPFHDLKSITSKDMILMTTVHEKNQGFTKMRLDG